MLRIEKMLYLKGQTQNGVFLRHKGAIFKMLYNVVCAEWKKDTFKWP